MSIVLPMPMIARRLPFWNGHSKRLYSTWTRGRTSCIIQCFQCCDRCKLVQAVRLPGACVRSVQHVPENRHLQLGSSFGSSFEIAAPVVQREHNHIEQCEENRAPGHGLLNTAGNIEQFQMCRD